MHEEKRDFDADVGRLLEHMAEALYSDKEIFLRELISNAADACDRLRYEALSRSELMSGDGDLKIVLRVDKKAGTLSIEDNGCGMNAVELRENLGTIARSGTAGFVKAQTGQDMGKLIGQFGVGFYSSFMVADTVEVHSRRAGEESVWGWKSSGRGGYEIFQSRQDLVRGTKIILHLKRQAAEFLENLRLRHIVKTYSDHIAIAVFLSDGDSELQQLNTAEALWMRPRGDISETQYHEFYHQIAYSGDTPADILHFHREGVIEYSGLLFIPGAVPFDLFSAERKSRLKLYAQRVFISDDCDEVLPPWLRFVRGVIDSQDLPLNISREMLQNNAVLHKIKQGVVKHILKHLEDKSGKEREAYETFWGHFGAVLKEGLYEATDYRDALLPLVRVHSLVKDKLISLDEYVQNMCAGQSEIYYISGQDLAKLRKSPQLEGFAKRGIDVLLMCDAVDEFWLPALGKYGDYTFKSVARGQVDLSSLGESESVAVDSSDSDSSDSLQALVASIKASLGDAVADVRVSQRLSSSAVCLVADEGEMALHMRVLMRQHGQEVADPPPILEINPEHALMRLAALKSGAGDSEGMREFCYFLLEQARLLEGGMVSDVHLFSERLCALLEKTLSQ